MLALPLTLLLSGAVLSNIAGTTLASGGYEYHAPQLQYGAVPATANIVQYHEQDAHGQYTYGYTAPLHSKHETRTLDGITRGTYSYIDAAGQLQTVDYTADATGFRVAATNLPSSGHLKPNEETPEVAALRAQHLEAHAQAKLRLAGGSSLSDILPQPVQDTPEVAAAKVAFFKRFEVEKLRNQLLSHQQPQNLPSFKILSQPIYVKTPPVSGFVYNYKLQAPNREYLPVA
ncbi:cuticle protein 6-like [Scaptodrosophila lebanonensis]|uniref:Cuticle protein 6-like n=1 Tax=Drosophila lebanonensis TaxID=7225 RepID=A0A6J2UF30_DROLE|nr:cuticle protein 6-like [Scaptodrosophila lebanonensis]